MKRGGYPKKYGNGGIDLRVKTVAVNRIQSLCVHVAEKLCEGCSGGKTHGDER